jgi:hypothetical protein
MRKNRTTNSEGFKGVFEEFWIKAGRSIREKCGERDINIYYEGDDPISTHIASLLASVLNDYFETLEIGYKAKPDKISDVEDLESYDIIEEMLHADNIILDSATDENTIRKILSALKKGYSLFLEEKSIELAEYLRREGKNEEADTVAEKGIDDKDVRREVLKFMGASINGDDEILDPLYAMPSVVYVTIIDGKTRDLKYLMREHEKSADHYL